VATVIKPKRSETSASEPTTSDLAVGEIAMNLVDKKLFTRDSSNNIITVANFSVGDPNLVFPTGDYGDLTNPDEDPFGVYITAYFDCKTTPTGVLQNKDLGTVS